MKKLKNSGRSEGIKNTDNSPEEDLNDTGKIKDASNPVGNEEESIKLKAKPEQDNDLFNKGFNKGFAKANEKLENTISSLEAQIKELTSKNVELDRLYNDAVVKNQMSESDYKERLAQIEMREKKNEIKQALLRAGHVNSQPGDERLLIYSTNTLYEQVKKEDEIDFNVLADEYLTENLRLRLNSKRQGSGASVDSIANRSVIPGYPVNDKAIEKSRILDAASKLR